MKPATPRTPSYRLHRASGHAVVTLGGREVYLGRHGTAESRAAYDRAIAEWLAAGRNAFPSDTGGMTINELILAYVRFADSYYIKDGSPTGEIYTVKAALRPVKRLYGPKPPRDFGPTALKAVRQVHIDRQLARKTVNSYTGCIKRMFKWAVSNELVPAGIYQALCAVDGLRRGRSAAREQAPVRPVPEEFVAAAMPFMSRQVKAMVQLQMLTGMRPGEVVIMRTADVDVSGRVWIYGPSHHKTEHFNQAREIPLGPQAQEVLRPFLKQQLQAFLFSASEAAAERRIDKRNRRKTPLWPSHAGRLDKQRRRNPQRAAGEHYSTDSYRRAIQVACAHADEAAKQKSGQGPDAPPLVPNWHPNQLRHNFATRVRKQYGIEAARILLGHTSIATTEIYAERDAAVAASIAAKVG